MPAKLLVLLALGLPIMAQTPTTRNVDLSWTASTSTGVLGYNMYRCVSPCTVSVTTAPLNGATLIAGTSFVDSTAAIGQTYTYAATANAGVCPPIAPITVCGSSDLSLSATTTIPLKPTPPTLTFQVTPVGGIQLTLTPTGTVGVLGYNLYRCTGTCIPSVTTAPVNGPALITGTSFVDATVVMGQTYSYAATEMTAACGNTTTVTATCGSSDPSAPATIVLPAKPAVIIFIQSNVP